MKISVVTPTRNQSGTLERTVRSVLDGGHPDVEHIVVDGGSTDATVEILRRHPHVRWTSEPDRGQADAINKGFRRATGEILCWLNSDDTYLPGALRRVAQIFAEEPDVDFIHGHCLRINEKDEVIGIHLAAPYPDRRLPDHAISVSQPASFWRRRVYETLGDLDTSFAYAMDLEYWLRIILRFRTRMVPEVLANFRYVPGTKSFSHPDAFLPEVLRAYRKHGGRRFSPFTLDYLWGRYVPRVKRLLGRPLRWGAGLLFRHRPG
ncbi:MAG: glycosyltransferase [Planctomycetales bacterium]|nr:glycosyltransferase [Planctomycetales bacterium]